MQILLTGASGYVGEHLARAFSAAGHGVVGTFLAHPLEIPGCELRRVDLTDAEAAGTLVRAAMPDLVVHCAAKTSIGWCEENPAAAETAIVGSTANLMEGLRRHAPTARLILFSTDLVFDGGSAPYSEEAAPKPLSAYGSLKSVAERQVLASGQGIVLRVSLVYGPPATRSACFLDWMRAGLGKPGGLTLFEDEWRTPVFVGDLADAIMRVADGPTGAQTYHAGGADRLSRVEMGRLICRHAGLDEARIQVARRHDLAGGHLRPCDVSLDSRRLQALGWKQTPFRDGLTKCQLPPRT